MQHFLVLDRIPGTASATCLALVMLACVACSSGSTEQALRLQVDAMQAAMESRDAGDVHALLAEDFVGNDGLDRRGARQLAAGLFLRHRDVAARFGPVRVDMRGQGDAVARFTVLATGGSGGLLPDSGQVFDVDTGWRLVDGKWQLLNARWKPRL